MSEFDFIRWLRSRTSTDARTIVGIGDDAAVLAPTHRPLLVTVDMLMDGTDFHLAEVGARAAGRKSMAVNLSDIAAMAGRPLAAVVSVALPRDAGEALGKELYDGIREMAEKFQVTVVGGDTNSWSGPLVVSITVIGETTERGPVLRSGAKVGDWIMATGSFGGSIRDHHLTFTPRVDEAIALHSRFDLHAMIDVSDGLAADLNHILEESHIGAILSADAIPISPAAYELSANSGKAALQHALGDGEDFELVFTLSQDDGERLLRQPPFPFQSMAIRKIGVCVESGLWLERSGSIEKLEPTGWVHPLGEIQKGEEERLNT